MSIEVLPEELQDEIVALVTRHPPAAAVVDKIISHFTARRELQLESPLAKKRKLQTHPPTHDSLAPANSRTEDTPILKIPGLAFLAPARKRMHLLIYKHEFILEPCTPGPVSDQHYSRALDWNVFAVPTPEKLVYPLTILQFFCRRSIPPSSLA